MVVCSFKPPFEDDAQRSHVSALVCRGFLFIHSFTVLVVRGHFVCVLAGAC